jgi:5-methylcytosine-specific restriction endonuclease McrA
MTINNNCGTALGHQKHRRLKEPSCDPCRLAYNESMRSWKKANREKVLASKKEYRQENSEKIKAYQSNYRLVRKDFLRERNNFFRRRNIHTYRVKQRQWDNRRRALKMGNGYSPYTLEQVLEEYGSICYLCEKRIDLSAPRKSGVEGWEHGLHLDHVIPLTKGGSDSLSNVAPTHARCNLVKSFQ